MPCQHGGKCLTSEDSAICLCPLGFSGDLCEIRVDLQVPAFNGSSHLRYRGLGEDALTWLDVEVILKPTAADGLLLYNGHRTDGIGDFMALYLSEGFVEFSFDLGTGSATVKSQERISMGEWHRIRISRTGRLAILFVDNQIPVEVISQGAFTQLSLPQNLYLGGVPNFGVVSHQVKLRSSFIGCVQKVAINGRVIPILAEALGEPTSITARILALQDLVGKTAFAYLRWTTSHAAVNLDIETNYAAEVRLLSTELTVTCTMKTLRP